MDLKRWIYSPDIARWLTVGRGLDLEELIDCILSAPHRTLEEKLEGLRELCREEKGKEQRDEAIKLLDKRIEMSETLDELLHMVSGLRNLYEADIFCRGRREEFVPKRIFTIPQPGIQFIREQIKEAADRYGIGQEDFFGVLRKYHRRGGRHMNLEWNILLNPEGKVLYCLPETMEALDQNDYQIGPCDYHYLKLPYPSGTVVETMASPFFPDIKGVVVNGTEPWEADFAEDDEQWLVYPDRFHERGDTGMGVILLNHYASITFGADFVLPFVQFFKECEGNLSKSERWLYELGELIKRDKSCFALILRDRQPGKHGGEEIDRPLAYVRELEERLRQGETKRMAKERHVTQAVPKSYQSDNLYVGRAEINEKGESFLNRELVETKKRRSGSETGKTAWRH